MLQRAQARHPFSLTKIDIAKQREFSYYDFSIPVIELNGRVICSSERIEAAAERRFVEALEAATRI